MRLPFEDITILDLSWVLAGPHATRQFCEMGAKVIKVESSRSIDVVRTGGQRRNNKDFKAEGGWAFNDQNRGKLDIGINLKSEKGREAFEELVKISDIVICNYGSRAFRKLRLTYEDLSAIKPDIIVLNASGLGDWGPHASFVTYAPVLMSMTGISGSVGYENSDRPYDGYPPLADYLGSMAVCTHLAAALEYRRRTGKGQFIDLSQGEAAVSYMGTAILNWQVNQEKQGLIGNHHYANSAAPHNTYKCKGDEHAWCAIAVVGEDEWKAFAQAVDPEGTWTNDPKFATLEDRIANQAELDAKVSEWTAKKSPREVGYFLQRRGISGVPVQTGVQLLYQDEHIQERDFLMTIDYPEGDNFPPTYLMTGPLMQLPGQPVVKSTVPAPSLGRDTRMILKEILGKSDEWIDEAFAEKAFE